MEALELIRLLRLRGRQPAGDLARLLDISRPTLMRTVRAAGDAVVAQGRARRTAYAARRALRGSLAPLPLYRVGIDGEPREIGHLHLTVPDGTAVEFKADIGWPLDADMADGWFDGLPYPLQDIRPQGFLGRHFARRHAPLLQVSDDPTRWSDDDALHALSLLGCDTPGDLIVGEAACRLWVDHVSAARNGQAPAALADGEAVSAYPKLADQALAHGLAGSSAGGEFPKFLALRTDRSSTKGTETGHETGPEAGSDGDTEQASPTARHVLVKFSGSDDAPGTQRWADLLVCEHLAAEMLRQRLDVPAARSRVLRSGGRTFLEVDRFDRHGRLGRSGLVSWSAVDGAIFGSAGRPWPEAGRRLVERGWLRSTDAARIERLWHFGRLIANTDMHDGNLSFQPASSRGQDGLVMAPAYDMLPMQDAPLRGMELPASAWSPSLPLPSERLAWEPAAVAAQAFWVAAAGDARISTGYQALCASRADALRRLFG
jgi:hypothetical protein